MAALARLGHRQFVEPGDAAGGGGSRRRALLRDATIATNFLQLSPREALDSSELDDYCKHCCSSLLALIGVVSPSARVFLDEPPKGFQWPSSRFRVRLRSAPLKDSLSDGMGIRLALAYRPTVALAAGATEIRVASVASRRVASRRTKSPWHESPASLRGTPRRAAHAALAYSCFVSHWDKVRLSLA